MTSSAILEEIDMDREWRKNEIKQVEIICYKLSDNKLNKIILKATIPMIYAHWEGFVVSSLKKITKYLNALKYKYNDFHINLLTNSYEENIKSLENSLGYEKRVKHLNIIFANIDNEVKFKEKIDVKSNLKFEVLKDTCMKFNLNIDNFEKYKRDLEQLLKIRNAIAHGESAYTFENYKDIEKYVNLLSNLMDTLYSEIDDFLKNEKYKKGH